MASQGTPAELLAGVRRELAEVGAQIDAEQDVETRRHLCAMQLELLRKENLIMAREAAGADTSRKRCRPTSTGSSTSPGSAAASTGRPSELYCPSINASMLAKIPQAWGVPAGMEAAGQELLLEEAAASTALWCSPCLQFWSTLCDTAPAPQDFADEMATLTVTLRDILLTEYTRGDEKRDAVIAALQASGAFPGVVKAEQGERQPDLRIKDQAFIEVKLAGGSGAASTQHLVYYVRTIAEPELLPVHEHCCAPILCIAVRCSVGFSCCTRLQGRAVSQQLCTWRRPQPAEELLRMLHAARAFCMEAARTWGGARRQAAGAAAAAAGGEPMRAPGSWRGTTRSEGPLPGVLPDWLRGYGAAEQVGGLSANVWRLRRAGDAVASAGSGQGGADSSSLPNELVVKFLEAAGRKQELALRSWAVHQAWARAGHAPAVVGKPWLCAGGRYLGYAMEHLPLQQEQGHRPGEGEAWRLLQHVLSHQAARQLPFLLLEQLSQAALAALQAAHQVEVDWAAAGYAALPPSVVRQRPAGPRPWPAVHGNMRPCNVAVCLEGSGGPRVRFLGFGSAGVVPGLAGDEHAARFPSSLNTAAPIWAYGVKTLGIISKSTDTLQLQAALAGFG